MIYLLWVFSLLFLSFFCLLSKRKEEKGMKRVALMETQPFFHSIEVEVAFLLCSNSRILFMLCEKQHKIKAQKKKRSCIGNTFRSSALLLLTADPVAHKKKRRKKRVPTWTCVISLFHIRNVFTLNPMCLLKQFNQFFWQHTYSTVYVCAATYIYRCEITPSSFTA